MSNITNISNDSRSHHKRKKMSDPKHASGQLRNSFEQDLERGSNESTEEYHDQLGIAIKMLYFLL